MIEAAQSLGLPYKEDPNLPQPEGIAYIVANISANGKRVSAANAFLTPQVRRRANLTIKTGITVHGFCSRVKKRWRRRPDGG